MKIKSSLLLFTLVFSTSLFGQSVEIVYELPEPNFYSGTQIQYVSETKTFYVEKSADSYSRIVDGELDSTFAFPFTAGINALTEYNGSVWAIGNFRSHVFRSSVDPSSLYIDNILVFKDSLWKPLPNPIYGVQKVFIRNDTLFATGKDLIVDGAEQAHLAFFNTSDSVFIPVPTPSNFELEEAFLVNEEILLFGKLNSANGLFSFQNGSLRSLIQDYQVQSISDITSFRGNFVVSGEFIDANSKKHYVLELEDTSISPLNIQAEITNLIEFDNKLFFAGEISQFPIQHIGYWDGENMVIPNQQPDRPVMSMTVAEDALWIGGKFRKIGDLNTNSRAYIGSDLQWNADTLFESTSIQRNYYYGNSYSPLAAGNDVFYIISSSPEGVVRIENGNYEYLDFPYGYVTGIYTSENGELYLFADVNFGDGSYLFKRVGNDWISQYDYDNNKSVPWQYSQVRINNDDEIFVSTSSYGDELDIFGKYVNGDFIPIEGISTESDSPYENYNSISDFIFRGDEIWVTGYFNRMNGAEIDYPLAILKNDAWTPGPNPLPLPNGQVFQSTFESRLFDLGDFGVAWTPWIGEDFDGWGYAREWFVLYDEQNNTWIRDFGISGQINSVIEHNGWLLFFGYLSSTSNEWEGNTNCVAWSRDQIVRFPDLSGISVELAEKNGNNQILVVGGTSGSDDYSGKHYIAILEFDLPNISGDVSPSPTPKPPAEVLVYPNPFNPTTTISVQLAHNSEITLEVFSLTGRKVANIVQNQFFQQGTHSFPINASGWASGTYIYRLTGSNFNQTGKLMVVK